MEMLTAMTAEVMKSIDQLRASSTFPVLNLLSGSYLTLDQVRGLYEQLDTVTGTQVSTSEGTSLMRPCNGSKRVSSSGRVGTGGKERRMSGARRAERAMPLTDHAGP